MNDKHEIDQLLNAFIDDQLSPREQTEVKRLAAHDPEIAKRLKDLQKCKSLLNSLPHLQAPSQILTNVMAEISLDRRSEAFLPKRQILGTIQFFLRKSAAAAALLLLVTGLVFMIYKVVSPLPAPMQDVAKTIPSQPAAENQTPAAATQVDISSLPSNEKTGPSLPAASGAFTARLELKTKTQGARLALQKLLEENLSSDFVILPSQAERTVYVLNSTGERIAAMQADLENLWNEFASAALLVETNKPGQIIVIDKITASQLADIASQQNLDRQLKAAAYFSIVNNIHGLTPESRLAAATSVSKPNDIPKPVLAKDEQPKSPQTAPLIHLTIEIGSE
jgi:anti-sigma factor RsiW